MIDVEPVTKLLAAIAAPSPLLRKQIGNVSADVCFGASFFACASVGCIDAPQNLVRGVIGITARAVFWRSVLFSRRNKPPFSVGDMPLSKPCLVPDWIGGFAYSRLFAQLLAVLSVISSRNSIAAFFLSGVPSRGIVASLLLRFLSVCLFVGEFCTWICGSSCSHSESLTLSAERQLFSGPFRAYNILSHSDLTYRLVRGGACPARGFAASLYATGGASCQ